MINFIKFYDILKSYLECMYENRFDFLIWFPVTHFFGTEKFVRYLSPRHIVLTFVSIVRTSFQFICVHFYLYNPIDLKCADFYGIKNHLRLLIAPKIPQRKIFNSLHKNNLDFRVSFLDGFLMNILEKAKKNFLETSLYAFHFILFFIISYPIRYRSFC